MLRLLNQYFTCPTWHRPLFAVVPDGIEIKCKACGDKHFIGRSHLENAWDDLAIADRATKPLRAIIA